MKRILYILLLLISVNTIGQPVLQRATSGNTVKDDRWMAGLNAFMPVYDDSVKASTNKGIDSSGAIYYDRGLKSIMFRQHSPKKWVRIATTSTVDTSKYVKYSDSTILYVTPKQLRDSLANNSAKFQSNIIMNGGTGNRLGYWVDGETIPVAGKTLDQAFVTITQRAVAPTYYPPTNSISSSPSSGNYEIGAAINITLSNTFTQNDAGSLSSTSYLKNGSPLGGNTDNITSLTSQVYYQVNSSYAQGACKNNNLGVPDCTGRINAGTITSNAIYFTPYPKRYWGYSSASAPTNGIVLASAGGNNELTTTKVKNSFNVVVSGTLQYVFYAYPASYGDLSSIIVGGFESIGAFTKTVLSVTNAQGYVQNYNVYTSNNQFTNTTITFNSVN